MVLFYFRRKVLNSMITLHYLSLAPAVLSYGFVFRTPFCSAPCEMEVPIRSCYLDTSCIFDNETLCGIRTSAETGQETFQMSNSGSESKQGQQGKKKPQ